MYNKKSRERLGRLSTDMHAILDTAKAQRRGLTSDERTRWHALESEFTQIEDSMMAQRTDGIINRLAQPLNPSGIGAFPVEEVQDTFRFDSRQRRREQTPHEKAFSAYVRGGLGKLDDASRALVTAGSDPSANLPGSFSNAMSTTTGSQGGYAIPQGFSDKLEEAMKWFGGIDGVVEVFRTENGAAMPYPTINDTSNKGRIIGQNVQNTETDLAFGQVTFNAFIGSSDLVLIPLALMEDSYFDLDALLARLLGMRLGRLINLKCTVGSGSGEPMGIVTGAVAGGNIVVLPNGNTTGFPYNSIVDVEGAVDPAYRYNPSARWMFSDGTLKLFKKLVDASNRPLWQPGISASFREGAAVDLIASKPLILDHPYVINQDMAVPAANAYSLLYGDMGTFKLRKVGDPTLMRLVERYADYLQVGFIAYQRFDSQFVDAGTHPIALAQQSAV